MTDKQKILLCGDVEGKFNVLYKRIETILKKSGPFDILLCVGNFFGTDNKEFNPYKTGEKKVPLPTYILGPNKEEHVNMYPTDSSDYEICHNVYYLGKRGIYTDTGGLKIAYISGIPHTVAKPWTYVAKDVTELYNICVKGNPSFKGVDILLTSNWPSNIIDCSSKISLDVNASSDFTSYLCMKLKPRYFVSGLERIYYESHPFRCPNLGDHDTTLEIVTRFIGLASVGNAKKDKWIYALSLTPLTKMKMGDLLQKTTDEINCPFNFSELEMKIFGTHNKSSNSSQYFYNMDAPEEPNKKRPRKSKIEFDISKCWFCLSSPSVEKHLIIAVGDFSYLALAKGGLVDDHFLICPIEHHQSRIGLPPNILKEIDKFKHALQQLYRKNSKLAVFFERNYKTSHMQIQAIPIPKSANRELKEIFIDESESQGFKLENLESQNNLEQVIPPKVPYFVVELPSNEFLYTKIVGGVDFPLNFPREVLASGPVLNLPNRIDWRECILHKDEEQQLIQKFKKEFEQFDFTTE